MIDFLRAGLSSSLADRVGWTLLHSVWEAAVVGSVAWVVLRAMRGGAAAARYAAASAGLLVIVALVAGTFALARPVGRAEAGTAVGEKARVVGGERLLTTEPQRHRGTTENGQASLGGASVMRVKETLVVPLRVRAMEVVGGLQPAFPWMVGIWMLGVLVLSGWHLGGWVALQRLRVVRASAAGEEIERMVKRLAETLRVRRTVAVAQSLLVRTPLVIGMLRPLILIPASVLTGLSPVELRAILAHELAHVRRHDYLVNLLQVLIETLLFYHPAVWWLSREIRREREHCCDDLAAAAVGDRMVYAEALVAVASLGATNALAMGVTGGGAMLARIQRLLRVKEDGLMRKRNRSLAAVLLAIGLLALPLWQKHAEVRGQTRPAALKGVTLDPPQGTVLDDSNTPVPNAVVTLYYNHGLLGNAVVEEVNTDAQGHFLCTHPLVFEEASGSNYTDHYVLFAKHPDYAIGWQPIYSTGLAQPCVLHLTEGRSVSFHVTDRGNHPLVGVQVGLAAVGLYTDKNPWFRQGVSCEVDPGIVSGVTDESGGVTLDHLPTTFLGFIATKSGFSPVSVPMKAPDARVHPVKLIPSAKVSGTVTDPYGHGIEGASVIFEYAGNINAFVEAQSDAQGRYAAELVGKGGFQFGDGGDGTYKVSIKHPDWTATELHIAVEPGQTLSGEDIHAQHGALVKGTLLGAETEKPVEGAEVEGFSAGGRLNAYTDRAGHFAWRVPPGDVRIFFSTPPHGQYLMKSSDALKVLAVRGDEKEVDCVIHTPGKLAPLITLQGKVLLANGRPGAELKIIPGIAQAVLAPHRTGYLRATTSNADGSFTIPEAPTSQPVWLSVQTRDHRYGVLKRIDTAAAGEEQQLGNLTLEPTRAADVLVTDEHGGILADTAVQVEPEMGKDVFWFGDRVKGITESDGHVRVTGILPGVVYRVETTGESNMKGTGVLVPTEGDAKPVELRQTVRAQSATQPADGKSGATVIHGRVLETGTERPVAGARVDMHGEGHAGVSFTTDSAGEFTCRVPTGTWQFEFGEVPRNYYLTAGPEDEGREVQVATDPTIRERTVTLHVPPLLPTGAIHGKVVMPDGSAAGGILVVPSAEVPDGPQTVGGLIYLNAKQADAEGRFNFATAPAGSPVHLYAETKDHKLAFAAEVHTKPRMSDQDVGTFTLEPTASCDMALVDAHQEPLAAVRINVEPTFGDNGLGNKSRRFTTDGEGRLRADGLVPGLHYKVSEAGKKAHVNVVLVGTAKEPAPARVMLDDQFAIWVMDSAGKPVPVSDIFSIMVTMDDGVQWTDGPKPKIIERVTDEGVLIDPEQVVLAHAGNRVTMRFKTSQDVGMVATGIFNREMSGMRLTVLTSAAPAFTLSAVPQKVPADEFGGRVLDAAGNPLAGATISVQDLQTFPFVPGKMKTLATTDETGRFRISTKDFFLCMEIDKSGFARRWLLARNLPKGEAVDVHLDQSTHLAMDVRLPDGTPATGATLTAVTSIEDVARGIAYQNFQTTATTNTAGHIDIPVQPGIWELRVRYKDTLFARLTNVEIAPGHRVKKAITLVPGVHLRMRAVDSVTGKPLTGAKFYIGEEYPGEVGPLAGSERATGADGVADWEAVMPGAQSIYCFADGYARHFCSDATWDDRSGINAIPLNLVAGMHEVKVFMEKGMRLTGKVVDGAGKPLANVFVNVFGLETGDDRYIRPTDAQGNFSLLVPVSNGYQQSNYRLGVVSSSTPYHAKVLTEEFTPAIGGAKSFVIVDAEGAGGTR